MAKTETEKDSMVKTETAREERGDWVTISLILDDDRYKDDLYVGLNGKGYLIKRGVDVEVPAGVAEIIKNAHAQELASIKYMDSVKDKNPEG